MRPHKEDEEGVEEGRGGDGDEASVTVSFFGHNLS